LLRDAQRRRRLSRIDLEADLREERSGAALHPAPVDDERESTAWQDPYEEILQRREALHQRRLLWNQVDATLLRRARRQGAQSLTIQHQLPGVGGVDAGEDLQQRRLSGTVLADERM